MRSAAFFSRSQPHCVRDVSVNQDRGASWPVGCAIGEISRDARDPKGVIANGGFDPGRAAKLAYPKAPGACAARSRPNR